MFWYQGLNRFTDFGKTQYRKFLNFFPSKCELRENWHSDSRTLLHGVNKFQPVTSTFLADLRGGVGRWVGG